MSSRSGSSADGGSWTTELQFLEASVAESQQDFQDSLLKLAEKRKQMETELKDVEGDDAAATETAAAEVRRKQSRTLCCSSKTCGRR